MRRMITFADMSYDPEQWEKLLTWGDPDTFLRRGSSMDEKGDKYENVIPDAHVMFVLRAKKTPAKITLIPLNVEMESKNLSMNQGGEVQVGNGFVYFDTRLGDIES